MTQTLIPFDRNPRLRRRSARAGTGQVYYGYALRRLLAAEPPVSKRDRDQQMTWLVVAMVVPAAVLAAALIVGYAR